MRWLTASRGSVILLALVLVVGGGNLWATHAEVRSVNASRTANRAALCRVWKSLAALPQPAGDRYDRGLRQRFEELTRTRTCDTQG